ncbi:MAG TPA: tetratricopeptide repeat protein [Terracidiphilus sp.]|nr:tetratricopeptide repeat protein [Terracidiphilus sp.]
MFRFEDHNWLPVAALLAAFMVGPYALIAQVSTPPPSEQTTAPAPATTAAPAPPQPSTQPAEPNQAPAQPPIQDPNQPAAPPPATAQPITVIPSVQPTPEQVGDAQAIHQHYQAAIAAYSKTTEQTPALWNKMGIAYQMMFNVKDAIRCYNASLKLDPKNAQVLNNLATVYDSQKQYGVGERYYRKALKIDPHSALILRNLGSNLLAQRKYKKGMEAYKAAQAIDPQVFDEHGGASVQNPTSVEHRGAVHYYMARTCASAGKPECAILNLRRALNEGFTTPKKIAGDGSFFGLRDLPEFQQLIAAQSTPQ